MLMNVVCEEVLFNTVNQETSITVVSLSLSPLSVRVCVFKAEEVSEWVIMAESG